MSYRQTAPICLLMLLGIVSCSSSDPESKNVLEAFESYRSALLEQNGEAAVEHVAAATIEMYQEHRDMAVSGSEKTVKELSMINRMQVLLIRHRLDPKLLKEMDGKALFVHAVNQNWIGKNSVLRLNLQDVVVRGTRASAKATLDGQTGADRFYFVKEEDRWKLDLVRVFQNSDQVLQRKAREKGMEENEFLFSVITSLSGRRASDTIWRPLEE